MESHEQPAAAASAGLKAHFDDCAASLLRLLSARLGNRTDAEDLLQELWLKLATTDARVAENGSAENGEINNPRAYLHRMALNLANDLVRERIRRRGREAAYSDVMVAEEGVVAVDPGPSPEQALGDKIELARVREALRQLPARAGEVFRRHRIEGQSHTQVAEAMGISRSAVEKHMATAMKYLLRALNNLDST